MGELQRRPALDIEFRDLTFSTPDGSGRTNILKAVHGHFRAGQLSAILGPSGAGKSTLMNILMGLISTNVTGNVLVNGRPRKMQQFNRQTTYIMQEDLLQPYLTVQESMEIAANLKLSRSTPRVEKLTVVEEILSTLGLAASKNTRTEYLSGGQKKRLSVALELVNNPPVIFLDEPTTGLDIVATKQMAQLLSLLASQGRTVVCSVHQPTASIFNQFDQVYVLARGHCVFQGEPRELVPFLEDSGLHCPTTHNPADFVLEAVQGENVNNAMLLAEAMNNGKFNWRLSASDRDEQLVECKLPSAGRQTKSRSSFPVSFFGQVRILLLRMLVQKSRCRVSLALQMLYYVGIGVLLGMLFYRKGDYADKPFNNFNLLISVNVVFMYSNMIVPVLTFPTELKMLKREHLNRWYGLKAYFLAHLISTVPSQMTMGVVFSAIVYVMSGHPLEIQRFVLFTLFGLTSAFVSEGHGMVVGCLFSQINGAMLGPVTMAPLLALSIVGLGYGIHVEPIMVVLRGMSYMRYSLVGITLAVFGQGRSQMKCSLTYCHYENPDKLLRDLGMEGDSMAVQFAAMAAFYTMYRVAAFLALRYRLSLELPLRIRAFVKSVLRTKSGY